MQEVLSDFAEASATMELGLPRSIRTAEKLISHSLTCSNYSPRK